MMREALSFDDVLLVPQYSEISSRADIDTSVIIKKDDVFFNFSTPFIPANMKMIAGKEMANFIINKKSLSILHRFMSVEDQIKIFKECIITNEDNANYFCFSIGVKQEDKKNVDLFIKSGAKIICIDIAHGHSLMAVDMCKYISTKYPDVLLIAGNVATAAGAIELWEAGADVVKVGIGSGSICTTRIETGNGVPQLTAIMDVAIAKREMEVKKTKRSFYFISDGGIKTPGDVCKALCYADMVMAGNIFAGTDECPGEIINLDGHFYKSYVGSSTHKDNRKEGVEALVPYKGPAEKVINRFIEGIQSCCSYQGITRIKDLRSNPRFVRITNSGLIESHPHDVRILK